MTKRMRTGQPAATTPPERDYSLRQTPQRASRIAATPAVEDATGLAGASGKRRKLAASPASRVRGPLPAAPGPSHRDAAVAGDEAATSSFRDALTRALGVDLDYLPGAIRALVPESELPRDEIARLIAEVAVPLLRQRDPGMTARQVIEAMDARRIVPGLSAAVHRHFDAAGSA